MYKVATGFVLTIAFLSIASINISITHWQHEHQTSSTENVIAITPPAQSPSTVSLSSSNPSATSPSSVVKTTATVYQKSDLSVVSQVSATSKSVNEQAAPVLSNHS